jgi:hypothetical protein
MPMWAWFAIALGTGVLVGLESWAWLRHGTSAIALAVAGVIGGGVAIIGVCIVLAMGYGLVGGVTGLDPIGLFDDSSTAAGTSDDQSTCDPNYEGACLDADAYDYDCEGGSGDGPEYTGYVQVVGTDVYDLDRDGDGEACE